MKIDKVNDTFFEAIDALSEHLDDVEYICFNDENGGCRCEGLGKNPLEFLVNKLSAHKQFTRLIKALKNDGRCMLVTLPTRYLDFISLCYYNRYISEFYGHT